MEFVLNYSSTSVDDLEYLVCRNRGSHDISKESLEAVTPVVVVSERVENGYGRSENITKNHASIIFGDFPPFNYSNASR